MRRSFLPVFATCFGLSLAANAADPANPLVGVWEIAELVTWNLDANTIARPGGERPTGLLSYSPGGHVVIFLANEERPTMGGTITDADRLKNYRSIINAYSGTYRIEGDKVTHHVTTAIFPTLNGTDQVRWFKIEGEKLILITAPLFNSLVAANVMAFVSYKRLE